MAKLMKMLVLFDLPTGNKTERKSYAKFRKFLLDEGFSMVQFSVYAKTCLGVPGAQALEERLRSNLPLAGSVTCIVLTEKMYASRKILVQTTPARKEEEDLGEQLTLVF